MGLLPPLRTPHAPTHARAHSQPPIACMPIPHDERHAHACIPMGAYAYAHPPEMLSHPPEIAQNTAILNDYAESEIDRRACMILLCMILHKPIILATPAEYFGLVHQLCYTLVYILVGYRLNISIYRAYFGLISISMVIFQVEDDACDVAFTAYHAPLQV